MNLKVSAFLIILRCLSINADDFKLCKHGDLECIKTTIDSLFKHKLQGDPSINLPKLFPLKAQSVHLQQGEESPVSLDLKLINNDIYGLETGKVVKVKGFGQDLTGKHSLQIHVDYFSTVGDYEVDGKILILPIKGSGKSNITMVDINLFFNFVGKPVEKDGSTYMQIEKLNFDAEPKKMIYNVENLFNGDKALGDNMNLFLNENWKEVFDEVRSSLAKAYGEVFKNVINSVFSKFPYDKYFAN